MRFPVFLLGVLVGCGSVCLYLHQEKQQYELQERCGKQARAQYEKDTEQDGGLTILEYSNHYNTKLNKCFYLETSRLLFKEPKIVDGVHEVFLKHIDLVDVNENKPYGKFFTNANEPAFFKCSVNGVACSSEQQWEYLVKPYMTE